VASPGGSARRVRQCVAFVATWTALGWLLRVDEDGHLLQGVPVPELFQLGVRRRPLTAGGPGPVEVPGRLGRRGCGVVTVLTVAPGPVLNAVVMGQDSFLWAFPATYPAVGDVAVVLASRGRRQLYPTRRTRPSG
jgi:hypothetical protein